MALTLLAPLLPGAWLRQGGSRVSKAWEDTAALQKDCEG